jgi:tRNA pseudouridine13 synthase
MKLKCLPEDFRVEELTTARADGPGRYTFYRLTKRNVGTIEVIGAVCRRWNLAGRRVSYAGLKDRHASTIQYLTIADGPMRSMADRNFELEPVGRLDQPYTSRLIRGNRFEIVLRGLTDRQRDRIAAQVDAVARDGLPNYFDDQRFGSVGAETQFIAHAWLCGQYERALRLALVESSPSDRSAQKELKGILSSHWGRWREAKAQLPRSSARSIVTYLVDHPTDFRGAFARIRRELRTLYFSAFQSHLWNLALARWLECSLRPDQIVPVSLKLGRFPFPRQLDETQAGRLGQSVLPLPCARSAPPEGCLGELYAELLQNFRLAWRDLRVKHLRDVFFSKGSRSCLVFPQQVAAQPVNDALHPGRHGFHLAFDLDKGSYATILVKRLTVAADPPR